MAKAIVAAETSSPRGSVSQRHVDIIATALAGRQTPLEFFLSIMGDENEDQKRREWAAEKAAPFIHPRQPLLLGRSRLIFRRWILSKA
jgi:hypothetical protein